MEVNLLALTEAVKEIAVEAGAVIMEVYERPEGFVTTYKEDQSPLTEADQKANEIICAGLEALSPEMPIISEENKQLPYALRETYQYCWMVDPLDGTKEFVNRNGEFTVNIALLKGQQVVLGVVYAPVTRELFWATRGGGAFEQRAGKVVSLQVATFQKTDPGLQIICSRSHLNTATRAFVEQYDEAELVARGSSLKFMLIARGEAHLYPRLAPTMEWDTAAAQIIVEEAGGQIRRVEDQQTLDYNKANLLNPFFIASGKEL